MKIVSSKPRQSGKPTPLKVAAIVFGLLLAIIVLWGGVVVITIHRSDPKSGEIWSALAHDLIRGDRNLSGTKAVVNLRQKRSQEAVKQAHNKLNAALRLQKQHQDEDKALRAARQARRLRQQAASMANRKG